MPPKRRSNASESAAASSSAKKSKTASASATASTSAAGSSSQETRWSSKDDRWSKVSNSRNLDMDYKKAMEDPEYAYTYVCRCPFGTKRGGGGDDEEDDWDEEEEEDEDEDEEDGEPKPKCDLGKTCLCLKPAAEHPEAPFVITNAAYRKLMNQQSACQVRDPDTCGMYTYNDHAAYGVLQVIQNLVLDFEEAAANWREQWVICEAMAPFFWYLSGNYFSMIDDGETASKTARLLGTLFLSMLARLEREGVLGPDSEVRDLPMVMAGWIKAATVFRDASLLEDDAKLRKSKKRPFAFSPAKYDEYVAAYARKHGVDLLARGAGAIKGLKACLDELDDRAQLPTQEEHGDNPWGFEAMLEEYRKECNCCGFFVHSKRAEIGGDSLDITSWSAAERKRAAFNKKDPFPKKVLDGLKDGMVIGLG